MQTTRTYLGCARWKFARSCESVKSEQIRCRTSEGSATTDMVLSALLNTIAPLSDRRSDVRN